MYTKQSIRATGVLCGDMTCGCDIIDGITCDNVSHHF
jgi:hypothetical protein